MSKKTGFKTQLNKQVCCHVLKRLLKRGTLILAIFGGLTQTFNPLWHPISHAETVEKQKVTLYETTLPDTVTEALSYKQYLLGEHYVIAMKGTANIRQKPNAASTLIKKMSVYEKATTLGHVTGQAVTSGNTRWYLVKLKLKGKWVEGYVYSGSVVKRSFDLGKMTEALLMMDEGILTGKTGYISNFKNSVGVAPKIRGTETVDEFQVQRYQAAPAYYGPDKTFDFRYLQDGRLVTIQDEVDDLYYVYVMDLDEHYYVPKKFVKIKPFKQPANELLENSANMTLTQAIVIDRKQQNTAVFQWSPSGWQLISRQLATTGAQDQYRYPTDLGAFMVLSKKPKFEYLDDKTKKLGGYAPYAIRFNGGAFIHGIPVDYLKPSMKDPGMIEYSASVGTIPKSHKCIRNYTSHAKFLYDWVKVGEAIVVVVE